jgi:spermidine synthase
MTEKTMHSDWFSETIYPDHAISFKIDEVLVPPTFTGFQNIAVYKNTTFGHVMVLDGAIQLTDLDEHFYHETVAHTAMINNPKAKHILIIGGGDCGIARELLKYETIQEIFVVDIDPVVTQIAKDHFPKLTRGVIGNKRLKIMHEDGTNIQKLFGDKKFDTIIMDTTDETETAAPIFSKSYLKTVHKQLAADGVLMRLGGSVLLQKAELRKTASDIKSLFGEEHIGAMTLSGAATYYGGPFCVLIAKKQGAVKATAPTNFFTKRNIKTRYLSPKRYAAHVTIGFNDIKANIL